MNQKKEKEKKVPAKKITKSPTTPKAAPKKVKKVSPKVEVKEVEKKSGLTLPIFDTTGKSAGIINLPKEIFGVTPNEKLLAQALHIYFANSKSHTAHTKTRGEVRGGGKKPWKQKGTGNARAGSIRSPLWVGGGTTFGPRAKKVKLDLPKKMRKQALISALSQKAKNGEIKIISNLEKIEPKTKIMANLLLKIEVKHPTLLISNKSKNLTLATRNIQKTKISNPLSLNAFEIIKNKNILISKDALGEFKI